MKYRSLEQIAPDADVHPGTGMSRRERLERWAELLEQQSERRLSTIEGIEFGDRREREAKRADNSPLTVACEDPILRAEGLRGDRVGDAVEFFDLSHGEVHRLVCYCHHGGTVSRGASSRSEHGRDQGFLRARHAGGAAHLATRSRLPLQS